MSLSQHPRAYGSAAVVAAFAAGILVTLGLKDLYPDLERRYQRKSGAAGGRSVRRQSSFFWGGGAPVELEDHEGGGDDGDDGDGDRGDGIEACIGNTPLVEIRTGWR
ncbi:hypothetical protein CDD83_2162 [Cordyceps sp. RAO-2017]|nr:hypothetical protein CDD83_2162 [Cordyceps sp. RAO-2017]